jgi:hypothetical protein
VIKMATKYCVQEVKLCNSGFWYFGFIYSDFSSEICYKHILISLIRMKTLNRLRGGKALHSLNHSPRWIHSSAALFRRKGLRLSLGLVGFA